jgi:hypothetical protein
MVQTRSSTPVPGSSAPAPDPASVAPPALSVPIPSPASVPPAGLTSVQTSTSVSPTSVSPPVPTSVPPPNSTSVASSTLPPSTAVIPVSVITDLVSNLKASNNVRCALPERFNGDRHKFLVFKNQCRSLFALRPQDYPTDTVKIESMGTFLSGAAAEWFYTVRQDWDDYESFVLHLGKLFGPVDPVGAANKRIRSCTQSSDVASYIQEFVTISASLNWDNNALMSQYEFGLSQNIKIMLLNHPRPTSLLSLMELSSELDLRYQSVHGPYRPKSINAVQSGRGKLTPEERNRRIIEQLCFYCASPDHRVDECPVKKPKPAGNERGQ